MRNKGLDARVVTDKRSQYRPETRNGKALGQLKPFQQPDTDPEHLRTCSPELYQGGCPQPGQASTTAEADQQAKQEHDKYGKASIVFVAHQGYASDKTSSLLWPSTDNFGLASGHHVEARLKSMASTALNAPVTAVIEYKYQRDGEVLIPAGARAVGKVFQTNTSGTLTLR